MLFVLKYAVTVLLLYLCYRYLYIIRKHVNLAFR